MLQKVTRGQLDLLLLGKSAKGFTVDDAVAKLEAPRQSVYQRIDRAIIRGWLTWEKEQGNGSRERYRIFLSDKGRAIIALKWGGKGRFLVPALTAQGPKKTRAKIGAKKASTKSGKN